MQSKNASRFDRQGQILRCEQKQSGRVWRMIPLILSDSIVLTIVRTLVCSVRSRSTWNRFENCLIVCAVRISRITLSLSLSILFLSLSLSIAISFSLGLAKIDMNGHWTILTPNERYSSHWIRQRLNWAMAAWRWCWWWKRQLYHFVVISVAFHTHKHTNRY